MSQNNNNSEGTDQSIYAGGGILWRGTPLNSEIAIVNRTRYGEEWCLPKGKQRKGEMLEQTAIREVKEETGCDVKIQSFALIEKYNVEGRKKYVFYWHMVLAGDCTSKPDGQEVKQMIWLPVKEAIKILTHQDQKKLIKNLLRDSSDFSFKAPRISFIFNSLKVKRLEGSLVAYRAELNARNSHLKGKNRIWADKAIELLGEAQNHLMKGNLDNSWKCFNAAKRMEIFTLDENGLISKSKSILNESVKLNEWRQKAVESILEKDVGINNQTLSPEAVYNAASIRDEHFDNLAYRDKLFGKYLITLLILLVLEIGLILYFFCQNVIQYGYYNKFKNSEQHLNFSFIDMGNGAMILSVILFGFFGGTISAITKIPSKKDTSRIPEQNYAIKLSLFRVMAGAASAVFIYIFIQTDLVSEIFNFDKTALENPFLILVISFVAGFSERLLLNAVSTIINEKK